MLPRAGSTVNGLTSFLGRRPFDSPIGLTILVPGLVQGR